MAHDQEVVGSNPDNIYWMDVRDATSYYINMHENNKYKEPNGVHRQKYIEKKFNLN